MKTAKGDHEKSNQGHKHSAAEKKSEGVIDASRKWFSEPGRAYLIFSIVVMVVLIGVIIFLVSKQSPGTSGGNSGGSGSYSGDKVKVEFYVMSQCPYGVQVENAIGPVLEKLDGAVDFQLNYIVRETSPGVFQSLHGEKEVKGNIAQLCVNSYYPDKMIDLVLCQNKDMSNVDTNWGSCAESLGLDTAKIGKCVNSDEGKNLLRTSMQRAEARQATGSPTIYINDLAYQGSRESVDFQRAICRYSKHPECANIPACASDADCTAQPTKDGYCINPGQKDAKCEYKDPVPVDLVVLNDEKCTACDTTRIVQISQQLFLGAKTRLIDVSSSEGKALVEKYEITVVPAYIFGSSVSDSKSWTEDMAGAFDSLSDGSYKLKDEVTGATYFVSEEARKAHYDAIGVVKGDNKPQIDFFVMSYCPFGNQAEEGIKPVYDLLKDKAIFKPRYVIYSNYRGGGSDFCISNGELCSMHGIQELNQNIREACVYKYDGIGKWFDFSIAMNTKCSSQNADSCWEPVAKDLGLDVARIKTCEANEGESLMGEDKALGDRLGVQGSPSIFIDGDAYNGARTPEAYKTGLCAAFESQPSECSTKLAGEATQNTGQAAPSC